ncbi:unnamed protein product [Peniophora sp. CBMAI 1063]|nr:unnamed protein product [Peniophora sp. CBMAI 1063]
MQRAREHHHHHSTCLPLRLHATITYTSPLPSSPTQYASDLRTLGLPPPSQKNLHPSQDVEGVVEAVWHTWADSDFMSVLVGKVRALNGREGVEKMRGVGVESVVLHKLRKDLTVPLPGATPLARASTHSSPATPESPALAALSPAPSSSASSSDSPSSTAVTTPSPAPQSITSPSPQPEACEPTTREESQEAGTDSDDDDEDLRLFYPDSDSEDEEDAMECDSVQPTQPLVEYPSSPVLTQSDTPRLNPVPIQDGAGFGGSWLRLRDENARLTAELQSARHDAELHKHRAQLLEQELRKAQSQLAVNQRCAPNLLGALLAISTIVDETMGDVDPE